MSSLKNSGKNVICIGRRPIKELLSRDHTRISQLLIAQNNSDKLTSIKELAESKGVEVVNTDFEWISSLANSDSHQGCLAKLNSSTESSVKDIVEFEKTKESSLIIALDSIQDPHNLGAVFRSADCFGASALIWSKNRGAQISPVVSKVSVGTRLFLPFCIVSNLVTALKTFKQKNFWIVLADVSDSSEELSKFQFPSHTVLVLGSEGHGAKRLVHKEADFVIKIPMCGIIDSLNISQAAAVFMNEYRKQYVLDVESKVGD